MSRYTRTSYRTLLAPITQNTHSPKPSCRFYASQSPDPNPNSLQSYQRRAAQQWSESTKEWRSQLQAHRKKALEQAGRQLSAAGLKLNEVTGYREVERLKQLVTDKGKSQPIDSCLTKPRARTSKSSFQRQASKARV